MKIVDQCVICDSNDLTSYDTLCSLFLAERVWQSKPFPVKLLHCNDCRFTFYNVRPENDELEKLYHDYRSPEYQKQRERFEKHYTKELNDSIGNNRMELEERKRNMFSIINGRFEIKNVKNVLDYGGDKGQFIIDEFNAADRYVYDISNCPLLPGINRVFNTSESDEKKFDFIMCCHVLEHVPNPHEIIENILKFSHKDTKFYFEVPYNFHPFFIKTFIKIFPSNGRLFHFYAKIRTRSLIDVFFQMHEHINFFSIASLTRLFEIHRLQTEYVAVKKIGVNNHSKILSCYVTMKNTNE